MNESDIESGARTVVQVAEYFTDLKARARRLAADITPQTRGYFTPAEEDDARALIVSYWQARNALFELITSFRGDRSIEAATHPQAFLTAFAAALVLVDAARFLRELAEHRPVVRRKFNEPAPQFGMPGGVYDTVQRSLLGARHGWHLYHATLYLEQHRHELQALRHDATCGRLLDLVDELRHRLDVSLADFASARLRTRADQLTRRIARELFGRAIYGLQKLSGSLVADKYLRYGHHPQLPAPAAATVRDLLEPGDIIIVRKEYALTNYFLPGYWPHAALFLGDVAELAQLGISEHEHVRSRWQRLCEVAADGPHHVLEAMKDGVHIRALASPFASDSVVVLRPQLAPLDVAAGLARCLSHEGKPYDFDFDFRRTDRLVCTEVVYRAYDGVGGIEIPLTRRAGRPNLAGSDLVRMGIEKRHFTPVAVFAPAFAPGVTTGDAVKEILQRGLE